MGDRWGAAFVRIGWQASFGLGGSFAPDWVAGITGIRTWSAACASWHSRHAMGSVGTRQGAAGAGGSHSKKSVLRKDRVVDAWATGRRGTLDRAIACLQLRL